MVTILTVTASIRHRVSAKSTTPKSFENRFRILPEKNNFPLSLFYFIYQKMRISTEAITYLKDYCEKMTNMY